MNLHKRPPGLLPHVLRRSVLTQVLSDGEEMPGCWCPGCGGVVLVGEVCFYRLHSLQVWCLRCGDSARPYAGEARG